MSDATTALAASVDKLATAVSKAVSTLDAISANPPATGGDNSALQDQLTKAQADLEEANAAIATTRKQVDDLTLQLTNSESPVQAPPAKGPDAPAGGDANAGGGTTDTGTSGAGNLAADGSTIAAPGQAGTSTTQDDVAAGAGKMDGNPNALDGTKEPL